MKEILKPEKPDATVSLKGLEYIDVPALGKSDYKLSFFTYKEGQYINKVWSHTQTHTRLFSEQNVFPSLVLTSPFNPSPQVTFRNEVSGEYLFYLVTFKATSPKAMSTIELETAVRRRASATVYVENPLITATCLTTECKYPDISAPPQHTVPGQSKVDTKNVLSCTELKKTTLIEICVCICVFSL